MILFGRTQDAFGTPFDKTIKNILVAQDVQSAIDELTSIADTNLRIVLLNTYNSTWTNNSFLGRTDLHPSTPIFLSRPIIITDLSFVNQNTTKNFFLDIYKNGQAVGNLVLTLTVNTLTKIGQTFNNLNLSFAKNDYIYFRYRSIAGTSPSDSAIEIYCKITGP
jgi:hypothetical protein